MHSTQDYSTLTIDELRQLIQRLQDLLETRLSERKSHALEEIRNMIAENELRPDEVAMHFAGRPRKKEPRSASKAPVSLKPKYRGPHGELWSGRGKTTNWLKQCFAEGASLEDFRIIDPKE